MHSSAPAHDGPSPSAIADLVLVMALIGVLTGLAWGVIWVQNAATADALTSPWIGLLPPVVASVCGGALLAVRRAYSPLPRLRRFLTRTGALGIVGALILGAAAAWIVLL